MKIIILIREKEAKELKKQEKKKEKITKIIQFLKKNQLNLEMNQIQKKGNLI